MNAISDSRSKPTAMCTNSRKPNRPPPQNSRDPLVFKDQKAAALRPPPATANGHRALLEIVQGRVEGQLRDIGLAAPFRDRRTGRREAADIAGQRGAFFLRQIRVVVAQID